MIQTDELRIGNLIKHDMINQVRVDAIEISTEHGYMAIMYPNPSSGFVLTNRMELLLNAAKPIPLTEKILLKIGFKKYEDTFYFGYLDCGFTLYKDSNGIYDIINVSEGQRYCFEIKYLHQLQNKYYAFEEKELEIYLETFKDKPHE